MIGDHVAWPKTYHLSQLGRDAFVGAHTDAAVFIVARRGVGRTFNAVRIEKASPVVRLGAVAKKVIAALGQPLIERLGGSGGGSVGERTVVEGGMAGEN